jgi:lysophospholipase L1-like esterase
MATMSLIAISGCNRSNHMPSDTAPCPCNSIKVVVIGDSTVATNPADSPQYGWGQLLQQHFTCAVAVDNHARNGRSSKSFIDEGLWAKALELKPNYVFVQFGHNDCPGKGPKLETVPGTTYKDYLRQYIDESRAIGAEVVLVTSMERRKFDADGRIKQDLKPYSEAAKEVAKEKGVFVIDLHDYSVGLLEKLGDAKSLYLNRDKKDRTHWSPAGAKVWADYITAQLAKAGPRYDSLKAALAKEK